MWCVSVTYWPEVEGEEFLLLCLGLGDVHVAEHLAQRLAQACANPV